LSCDTVVANERYADWGLLDVIYQICSSYLCSRCCLEWRWSFYVSDL